MHQPLGRRVHTTPGTVGKAFLAVKGVVVRDRKAPVRKPKALAVVPPSSPPVVRPSSPAPAPTPTLIAIPEAA